MSIDKVILITGSSTGFGRGAAETLARKGHTVWASMRDLSGKNAVHKQTLQDLSQREGLALSVLELDVTDDDSVEQAVGEVLHKSGRIDVVINNAGIGALGVTEAYMISEWKRLFEVNLFGAVRVNRAVLPAMRRQRAGLLIHVGSAAGRLAIPYFASYCASKFALEALADAYRFELKPFGIDSVMVEPGIHKTPILENFQPPMESSRADEYPAAANYSHFVKATFDAANLAPETPGVEAVVDAFVNLIETPFGRRPFRSVPTLALQPLLEPLNAASAELRQTAAHIFGVADLLS